MRQLLSCSKYTQVAVKHGSPAACRSGALVPESARNLGVCRPEEGSQGRLQGGSRGRLNRSSPEWARLRAPRRLASTSRTRIRQFS